MIETTLARMQTQRDAIAQELDRAVEGCPVWATVGALKQSQWYQDRKALLMALDNAIAAG